MQLLKRLLIISVLFTVSQFLFSQSVEVLDDGVLEVVEDDYAEVSSDNFGDDFIESDTVDEIESTQNEISLVKTEEKKEIKTNQTKSQSTVKNTKIEEKKEDVKKITPEEKTYAELPRGYRGVFLGMNLETTKDTLLKHPEFGYHGERDVSLLPGENRVLISTDADSGHGSPFLCESYFQFYEDFLYVITVNINRDKMDYYSMFKKLTDKYGPPSELNPQTSKWENETTIVYLEKPLLLKYIDKAVFDKTLSKSSIDLGPVEITRDLFLDEL